MEQWLDRLLTEGHTAFHELRWYDVLAPDENGAIERRWIKRAWGEVRRRPRMRDSDLDALIATGRFSETDGRIKKK